MDSKDDHPLYAAINGKLAEIAAASPVRLPWHEAWQELAPTSTPRERLPVYRAIRDSGSLPAEAGFFLVAWIVDLVVDEQAEEALRESESRLEALRQQHGLDDDTPADENAPPEYREAMQASHDAWDELYAATLDDLGELEMAQLYRADNDQFEREYRAGQQFFHGEDVSDNDWLDELHDAVSACVEAESLMAPLGLRYFEDAGLWEIVIYPSPVELVGGDTTARW